MPRKVNAESAAPPRYPLNLRTNAEIHDQLKAAAQLSGRSLTSEATMRLERSLRLDRVLGSRQVTELMFAMGAAFAHRTWDGDWTTDVNVYTNGVQAVLRTLLRSVPPGPDQKLARLGVISQLLTWQAQLHLEEQEGEKQAREDAA